MPTSASKKGPRGKTGCLTCRARHKRCTEELPTCSACLRANLKCERTAPIVFEPRRQTTRSQWVPSSIETELPSIQSPVPFTGSSEVLLLRRFQQGIATWMDLFDQQQRYQILLMREAANSKLLRHAICALAARQLALQAPSRSWEGAASEHYGSALQLQSETVQADPLDPILLPAATLLASYELMLLPGHDYTQHFFGAKAILEAQFELLRANALWLAAYWVFFRHDVSVALSNDSPIRLRQQFWIEPDITGDVCEDVMGNYSLLLLAKSLRMAHDRPKAQSVVQEDPQLQTALSGWNAAAVRRFSTFPDDNRGCKWYAIPSAAVAIQQALTAELIIRRCFASGSSDDRRDALDKQLGEDIIKLSIGDLPDYAQTQSVHYLCFVGRTIQGLALKGAAAGIMRDLQARTGFHTSSRIAAMEA